MEWSSLELELTSCRHIKSFNFFHKISVYAVVSIINDELKKKEQQQQCLQRQKTPIDREGGRNPEWNHVMQFDLKAFSLVDHLFLKFDLRCEGIIFGNRSVGEVRVPLKDLMDEFNGHVRFVSYQVRDCDGRPNGVLNFSYKLNGKMNKIGKDSSETSEKVHYPSLQVENQSKGTFYPSLDYLQSPSIGTSKLECWTPELYGTTPPPPSPPQLFNPVVSRGAYYDHHPEQWPMVNSPEPFWHAVESNSWRGCPGVDVDAWKVGAGTRRDSFPLSG